MEISIINTTNSTDHQTTNDKPSFVNATSIDLDYQTVEQLCITILLVCCLLAVCINCVVIVSVNWITNSMSPNLKISVSLAIADVVSSSMTGLVLLLDKLSVRAEHLGLFPCLIELVRLSGIVITVLHLLALSFNHYIGILKPLHYNVIVTKRKVTTVISILWILPVLLLIILSTVENNGVFLDNLKDNICTAELFSSFAARLSYSMLFFLPVVLMVYCYTHILMAVKKQRNKWKDLSRSGSSRAKGRNVNSQKVTREQARLQGSIKAIHTTLLILGSCFVGWMPALLSYILMCKDDCPITGETLDRLNNDYKYEVISLRLIENMLIIMKMFANPIIYTIRIKEIKDSTNRMYLAVAGFFCPSRRPNTSYGLASQRSLRNHTSAISVQLRMNSVRTSNTDSQAI